ncbi:MAG TPA: class I SAM-dependent methyltransferase [Phycisphaerae bacterium]|nr:class I SAM-dependent methyltransferase [Phycisphaerae bacterium]
MTQVADNSQNEAYSEAVKSGLYARKSGLVGKYDNVRRYWEDEITRIFLRPHLQRLIDRCQAAMRRVRILDLGCGSADGYELLNGVRHRDADLEDVEVTLLTPGTLGMYKGVDLCPDLIAQASAMYGDDRKLIFQQADFTEGLPVTEQEKPYDLYFTSYGTCSHHNDDETFIRMMVDIAQHVEEYCVVVCDWLGRYSYEWQTLWTNDLSENRNMDYVVSYIYEPDEASQRLDELQHLCLRLVSRQEAEKMVAEASARAGVEIKPLSFFDRSIFTGRHMDTAEYNPHAQPIRQAVNLLHETNQRTDLSLLLVDYMPSSGFEFLDDYFEHLQMCWNTIVLYVDELLQLYDERERRFTSEPPPVPASYPPPLQEMMERMKQVVGGVGWLGYGLPRENIIEPQLGYSLRHLVMNLQQGLGCAHGLVGIFEIDKR